MDQKEKVKQILEKPKAGAGIEVKAVPEKKIEMEAAPPTEKAAPPSAEKPITRPPVAPPPLPPQKDPELLKVEQILSEDLAETYFNLPPELQNKFKAEGERVAATVWQMIRTAQVQVKKIFELIINWLKMIPGVNRYFLEQESKIKADKILTLIKKE